jgi:hypothetical protein
MGRRCSLAVAAWSSRQPHPPGHTAPHPPNPKPRNTRQDRWQREDQERHRRQRERARTHQPPPHAGTSRPRVFCGACGGLRATHTYHHDDAAHERARRRYEGLRAKAASTTYGPEAAACNAKAEQLRDKYGL